MPTNKHLPRILCLHGQGVSAAIFSIQTRRIQHLLRFHFRFIFIDAPFEAKSPGSNILPTFEGAGPFFEWVSGTGKAVGREYMKNAELREEQNATRKRIEEALSVDDGAPFWGVMGFSQGVRVASGLLARQQSDRKRGLLSSVPVLRFGIMLCGTCPPIGVDAVEHIRIPTIHVHGLQDPYLSQGGELLRNYFDSSSATCLEFDGGHHIMTSEDDLKNLLLRF